MLISISKFIKSVKVVSKINKRGYITIKKWVGNGMYYANSYKINLKDGLYSKYYYNDLTSVDRNCCSVCGSLNVVEFGYCANCDESKREKLTEDEVIKIALNAIKCGYEVY